MTFQLDQLPGLVMKLSSHTIPSCVQLKDSSTGPSLVNMFYSWNGVHVIYMRACGKGWQGWNAVHIEGLEHVLSGPKYGVELLKEL